MTSNNTLKDVYLNRVSAFLPNAPIGNDEMEAVLGMAGDVPSRVRRMILRSNGILSRHYAIDPESRRTTHTNAELAAEAVNGLFAQGVPAEAIGSLACATSYPDQTMPGHGVMVHGLLDMPPCEVFSMAGVCAAGMAAMKHAYNAVRTGEHAHAVSVASENASAVMRGEVFQSETDHKKLENASPEIGFEKDFLRWMLSDGAGAVYLSDRPNSDGLSLKIHWIDLLSYATEMAVFELDAQTQAAREAVEKGEYSPLYYHMFRCRYDETGLAMSAGVWKWQLRRHFRPEVFAKLPAKTLQKYADACQISIDDLKQTNI